MGTIDSYCGGFHCYTTHSSPFHSNFSGIIGEHLKSGSMNTFESIPKAAMNAAGASLGGVNRCL